MLIEHLLHFIGIDSAKSYLQVKLNFFHLEANIAFFTHCCWYFGI